MDLQNGDVRRVSPGVGKATCPWIHPSKKKVLFASTHLDPQAREKQKAEFDKRASGETRRYSWDFDEHYDLFETDLASGQAKNLTKVRGYDAEAAWSPDGSLIVFASNRHAYTQPLSPEEQEIFARDPSSQVELYLMRADGTQARRLTTSPGYDGGPFFSADGQKICWRHFSEDGATAEIFTMNVDGAEVRQTDPDGRTVMGTIFSSVGRLSHFCDQSPRDAEFRTLHGRCCRCFRSSACDIFRRIRRAAGIFSRWEAVGVDQCAEQQQAIATLFCRME